MVSGIAEAVPAANEVDPALAAAWPELRRLASRVRRTSLAFAIGSVTAEGHPHVSPIGSFRLLEGYRGSFFELFAAGLGRNLDANPAVTVLAVDSGRLFWLRSLVKGRFERMPAARLTGYALPRREATDHDRERWARQVRYAKWTKGYDLLWRPENAKWVREIQFERYEPVRIGAMWTGKA